MTANRKRNIGAALAAVLLVAGAATGCEDGAKESSGQKTVKALNAAYEKTSAAKSAKVRMTMTVPASLGAGGTVEMTGVQGWNPQVMDITMKGSVVPGAGGESMRVITANDATYVEIPPGSAMASGMDGKRWMKMDLRAAAEAAGDAGALSKLTGLSGAEQNQDPAKQLALLLSSPNVERVGSEKVEGKDTEHYKGTVTLDEMLAANESSAALTETDRKQLAEAMKKAGIKGYDMDVWVNGDGYPARMKVGIGTAQGRMDIEASYSDYGSGTTVQTPPEGETFDLFAMLGKLGQEGAGA
ncbi:hypothetical protein ABZZ17_02370 [Streptomyces sp. NPDC006512]|uniref:hypothetical protein n=1 Tax=Streptomyces sp. NPDC006512 TaxID=3154307 RepID=UPI0033B5040B